MLFIPAIDIIDGKCVRLIQGDFERKVEYSDNPADVARHFEDEGARLIHVVDLDAARSGSSDNLKVIEKIVGSVSIPVQVGGGVRDRESASRLLDIGADRIVVGTLIVKDLEQAKKLVGEFGTKLAAGLDARDGIVRVFGWTESGFISAFDAGEAVKSAGFSLMVYTDISRDGALKGPNIDGIRAMALKTGIPLIASGGVSSEEDLLRLKELGAHGVVGVIAGKALYEGKLSVKRACEILEM